MNLLLTLQMILSHFERAKLELQRYLSDVITDQCDENGCFDPLKVVNST